MEKILAFVRDESGLTTVEYAVAGTLIALGVVGAFSGLRDAIIGAIGRIAGVLAA